jgi:hypothetical protein
LDPTQPNQQGRVLLAFVRGGGRFSCHHCVLHVSRCRIAMSGFCVTGVAV